MDNDERYLKAHLSELASRSEKTGIWQFSDFLSLAEQNFLPGRKNVTFCGGYELAERRIAVFGREDYCGEFPVLPIKVLVLEPSQKKFAEDLSHRDYLGTIMGLGIRRGLIGDILLQNGTAYVLCLESIGDFLKDSIVRVKKTTVHGCLLDSLPQEIKTVTSLKTVIVPSLRCDALISSVFHLSRNDAKELFEHELVFFDGKLILNPSRQPECGTIVSVRGKGRFRLEEVKSQTKKGNLAVNVLVY